VPIHGIGHSNGALMHAMIGALCSPENTSNVLISFNNRQVAEAVPVPLTPLRDVVRPMQRMSGSSLEKMAQAALDQALSTTQTLANFEAEMMRTLQRFVIPVVGQVGSVLDEVALAGDDNNSVDFSPTPEENRRLFAANYMIPNTLLVQFVEDSIDQTEILAGLIEKSDRSKPFVGRCAIQILPGNHLTPTGVTSSSWSVNGAFGPGDALTQAAVAFTQRDLRRLGARVIQWLGKSGTAPYIE